MNPFVRTAIAILLLGLLLQGCGNYREINDLAIVDMVGVDLDEKGDYLAYYQVVNPAGIAGTKSGGNRAPVYTYAFRGKSWAEFTSKATQTVPREIFVSHFQAYIVSERLAAKGMGELLNYLESESSRRMATAIFITKDPVREIMNNYVPLEMMPGKDLRSIRQLQIKFTGEAVGGESLIKTLLENFETSKLAFVSNIALIGKKPFTSIKRYENMEGNRSNFVFTGVSMIKKGRFIGELKPGQAIALFFALGSSKTLNLHIDLGNDESVDLQMLGKPKIKRRLTLANGTPMLRLTIEPKLKLQSIHQNKRLDSRTLRRLEGKFNEEMSGQVREVLNLAEQKKWDLLGLEERIAQTTGKGWAALKQEPDGWTRTKVTFDIHSSIVKTGVLATPYQGD